jgi:hypothetical protein
MKTTKNNVAASIVILGFMGLLAAGCNKYDKMSIVGTWEIDLKAAKHLAVDSSKETLYLNSGAEHTYTQHYMERNTNLKTWTVEGKFDRKNNKITFHDRVEDQTTKKGDETFKYRVEDNKLIFIVENEGFDNNEKIYTKKK